MYCLGIVRYSYVIFLTKNIYKYISLIIVERQASLKSYIAIILLEVYSDVSSSELSRGSLPDISRLESVCSLISLIRPSPQPPRPSLPATPRGRVLTLLLSGVRPLYLCLARGGGRRGRGRAAAGGALSTFARIYVLVN